MLLLHHVQGHRTEQLARTVRARSQSSAPPTTGPATDLRAYLRVVKLSIDRVAATGEPNGDVDMDCGLLRERADQNLRTKELGENVRRGAQPVEKTQMFQGRRRRVDCPILV